jgi:hypothetical protein
MTTENLEDQLSFTCYNCRRENSLNRKKYINGNEEYFLEAAGNTPKKDVIISCVNCNSKNKVSIPYF